MDFVLLFMGLSAGSLMVAWAGPKGRANKHKKNKVITSGECGETHEGSEKESHVEGCYEVEESSCQIKFERKRRSNSEGDYGKKPAWDARPMVYFLKNDKGLFQATPKKMLGHIVRLKWDEHTLNTKGAKREAFYDSCIKKFKIYDPEDGDRVVRAHLKRNFKSYLNAERGRLMEDVNKILKRGYPESVINIRLMRPYYFSQRAWNAICDHWETPEFANKSEKSHNSRMKVEFTPPPPRTGAKPFDQRRETSNEGEAQSLSPTNCGRACRSHGSNTVGQKMAKKSHDPVDDVSDDIYVMMSTVFDEVSQILHSLPTHEVKRSILDEEIHTLAIAASPNSSLQTRYMRTADALLHQIVKNIEKIILEETQSEKIMEVHKSVEVDGAVNQEDEDIDAHNYPLF
ncbi:hypothetical protein POM88_045543 [Heracleum sosnowskyi]|uniref:Uncharacterized protein n=1 Tax=Heracleum sosnowskyi TaxID=360622 RepID=A0AAD8M653_9APIA|nr:hypothetical protein POM88_045543 [Heracleum sosnowskyi]